MAIPENIQREHILSAIIRVIKEDVPSRRQSRTWALKYEGELYPVKLLISWANVYANGEELDYNPNTFTSHMAKDYLEDLRFTIVNISSNED